MSNDPVKVPENVIEDEPSIFERFRTFTSGKINQFLEDSARRDEILEGGMTASQKKKKKKIVNPIQDPATNALQGISNSLAAPPAAPQDNPDFYSQEGLDTRMERLRRLGAPGK